MPGIWLRSRRLPNNPRYSFVRADIADAAQNEKRLRKLPAGRHHASRGRKPRRSFHRRARGVHADQYHRHLYAAGSGACPLARLAEEHARTIFASIISRPTKFSVRWIRTAASPKTTAYDPRSPYSASKAASDHLVRAWHHTYGLPVLSPIAPTITAPITFPKSSIPLTIINGLEGSEVAGLRRRRQRARLALCRGSCACAARRRQFRAGGRDILYRRPQRAHQSGRRQGDLRAAR